MATRDGFTALLAAQLGDVNTNGSPMFHVGSGFRWAQPIYTAAIEHAWDLLHQMFLIPQESAVAMDLNATIYEITPPADMVYITDIARESAVGGGLYNRPIPWNMVDSIRNENVLLDKTAIDSRNLWLGSAAVWFKGYRYGPIPAAAGTEMSINNAAVLNMARGYMFQNSANRDPADMMRSMRQAEAAFNLGYSIANEVGNPIPEDGGMWIEQRLQ